MQYGIAEWSLRVVPTRPRTFFERLLGTISTVAISIKQGTACRLHRAWPVCKFLSLKVKTGKNHACVNVQPSELTLGLVSVADFFTTDITKQVLNVNGELLKALHW